MVLQYSLSLSLTRGAISLSPCPAEGIPTFIPLPIQMSISPHREPVQAVHWFGHSPTGLTYGRARWAWCRSTGEMEHSTGSSRGNRITPLSSNEVLRETHLYCKPHFQNHILGVIFTVLVIFETSRNTTYICLSFPWGKLLLKNTYFKQKTVT